MPSYDITPPLQPADSIQARRFGTALSFYWPGFGTAYITSADTNIYTTEKTFIEIDNWSYVSDEMVASGAGPTGVFQVRYKACLLDWGIANLHMVDCALLADGLYVLTTSSACNPDKLSKDEPLPLPSLTSTGAGFKVYRVTLEDLSAPGVSVTSEQLVCHLDVAAGLVHTAAGSSAVSFGTVSGDKFQGVPSLAADGSVTFYAISTSTEDGKLYAAVTSSYVFTLAAGAYAYTGSSSLAPVSYGYTTAPGSTVTVGSNPTGYVGTADWFSSATYFKNFTGTGYRGALKPSTFYSVGDRVYGSLSVGYLFRHYWTCTTQGVTASSLGYTPWTRSETSTEVHWNALSSFTSGTASFSYGGVDSTVIAPTISSNEVVYSPTPTLAEAQAAMFARGTQYLTEIQWDGETYEFIDPIDFSTDYITSAQADAYTAILPSPWPDPMPWPATDKVTHVNGAAVEDRYFDSSPSLLRWVGMRYWSDYSSSWGYYGEWHGRNVLRALCNYSTYGTSNPINTGVDGDIVVGAYRGDAITVKYESLNSGGARQKSGTAAYFVEIQGAPSLPTIEDAVAVRANFPSPGNGSVTDSGSETWGWKYTISRGGVDFCTITGENGYYAHETTTSTQTFAPSTTTVQYVVTNGGTGGNGSTGYVGYSDYGAICNYATRSSVTSVFTPSPVGSYTNTFDVTHTITYVLAGVQYAVNFVVAEGSYQGEWGGDTWRYWALGPLDRLGGVAATTYFNFEDPWTGATPLGAFSCEHLFTSTGGEVFNVGAGWYALGADNNTTPDTFDDAYVMRFGVMK